MRSTESSSRLTLLLILLILGGLFSLALAAFLLTRQAVTIYDGEQVTTLNGRFATVSEALQAAAITLRPEDLVQPPPDSPATDTIQIQRARPVVVSRDGRQQSYWTRQPNIGGFLLESGLTLGPRQELLAGQSVLDPGRWQTAPLPDHLAIEQSRLPVVLEDGREQQEHMTTAVTVAELLVETGIILEEGESVSPPPETLLAEQMVVRVQRTLPLTIVADGQTLAVRSAGGDPTAVLATAGLSLGELDYTIPTLQTTLRAGDTLRVVRVREERLAADEVVPFQTVYQPSAELDLDAKAQLSPGTPGLKQRVTVVRYEDGQEVSRVDEGEVIVQEPVNEVIGYGTRIVTNVVDTPEGPREYWRVVRMRATAYTAASSGKAPDHPAYGITASGRLAGTGIVAIDPNVVPFRSEVYVPGYGIGFAGDTGGGVKGRWIDLGYDEDELQTWNGYADVYYLTPVPAEITYLLPEVLP